MITVTVAGRLGKDAELRQAGDTTVCSFNLAGDTGFGDKKQTHWFECSLWGRQGEALTPYLQKGQQVTAVGEYSEREYNGNKYKQLKVMSIELQGGNQAGNQQSGGFNQNTPAPQQWFTNNMAQPNKPSYADVKNGTVPMPSVVDDSIPF